MFSYRDFPEVAIRDLVRLRRRLDEVGFPQKRLDDNLIVGSWNIAQLGRLRDDWVQEGDPVRNLRGLATIGELVKRFDVLAIQEVKRETHAIRRLVDEILGPHFGLIMSDVSEGDRGNTERLAFIYDKRRVQLTGLAGEIVLAPEDHTPEEWPSQFVRTPYIVGFDAGSLRITLLTVHIHWGDGDEDPAAEVAMLAPEVARRLRDRSADPEAEAHNLILLGDFNMHAGGPGSAFAQALADAELIIPPELFGIRTTVKATPTHYDHMAWFSGALGIPNRHSAGSVPFDDIVYRDRRPGSQIGARVSDHFPVWVEFSVDRSIEEMAEVLGVEEDSRMIDAEVER